MKKLVTLAGVAAMALALVPVTATHALAQSMAKSAIVASDHSMRGSKLIGMDIFNEQGQKIGKIEDLLIKGSASEPVAVLSVGGEKMVGVPVSHITLKADKASMAATPTQIAAMPAWHFDGLEGGGG